MTGSPPTGGVLRDPRRRRGHGRDHAGAPEDQVLDVLPGDQQPVLPGDCLHELQPENAPRPWAQWSLMTETSGERGQARPPRELAEETVRALVEDGLLPDQRRVVSVAHRYLPQAYPTPFLGQDALVDPALRAFEGAGHLQPRPVRRGSTRSATRGPQLRAGLRVRRAPRRRRRGGVRAGAVHAGLVNNRRNP